ncbi:Ig-like domain-containing protein [Vibrio sinaloensis]|nr:Ig-like domain-containing protein [Vibrio sinaloensis]
MTVGGLCVEPIEIPLQSVNSPLIYPLDNASLNDNVLLLDSQTMQEVETKLSNDGRHIRIECDAALESAHSYYLVVTKGVQTQFGEPLQTDSRFTQLLDTPLSELDQRERVLKQQTQLAVDAYINSVKGASEQDIVYAATFTTQDSYALLDKITEQKQRCTTDF